MMKVKNHQWWAVIFPSWMRSASLLLRKHIYISYLCFSFVHFCMCLIRLSFKVRRRLLHLPAVCDVCWVSSVSCMLGCKISGEQITLWKVQRFPLPICLSAGVFSCDLEMNYLGRLFQFLLKFSLHCEASIHMLISLLRWLYITDEEPFIHLLNVMFLWAVAVLRWHWAIQKEKGKKTGYCRVKCNILLLAVI